MRGLSFWLSGTTSACLTLPALLLSLGVPAAARAQDAAPAAKPATVVADLHSASVADDSAGGWDYAAVDPATGAVLVARNNGVQTIPASGGGNASILAKAQHSHAIIPLPGKRLLVTNGDSNTATVIDAQTGALQATLQTGMKPDGAIFDAKHDEVLVMDGKDGTVTRISIAGTPHVTGQITIGGKLEAPAVGTHRTLFVNVEDHNAVAIVSLKGAGKLEREVKLDGCEAPSGLAFDPTSKLLVSACENGMAKVIDEDGKVRATLAIGPKPDAAIGDAAHHRVFIPSGGDGTLSEISLEGTPHVTRVWQTRPGARTGALDAAKQVVYLPYGTVVQEPGKPKTLVPGSFGVLAVDVR